LCWTDSCPLIIEEELHQKSFHPEFLEDYDGAKEEIGNGLSKVFGQELETSVFFDADHAQDHKAHQPLHYRNHCFCWEHPGPVAQ
jgi:hypothetical protein